MSKAKEFLGEASFHDKDDLLKGITFGDLTLVLTANEPKIDEKVVKRVFKEILAASLEDAEFELKKNMKEILAKTKR